MRRALPSLALMLALGCGGVAAQGPREPAPAPPAGENPLDESLKAKLDEKAKREQELRAAEEALAKAAESRARLEAEIAGIKADRAKLNAALIDTAAKARAAEDRMAQIQERLATAAASESGIRKSLAARRVVIAEVLAALQRIDRHAPPAVLARPEDMLASVRTAMMLGAVVPGLRAETEALAADLAELVRVRALIAEDKEKLAGETVALGQEQERLKLLIAARQERLVQAEGSVSGERARAAELAANAKSLKELVDGMEREVASARRAAEEAKKAAEAQARQMQDRFAAAAFRDPARLAPKIPFVEARGILPKPVAGETLRDFGVADGYGGTTHGIAIKTRFQAVVSSPADGWVAFAGPFRSFGRVLIINAGGGYYLLLAGMDQINVEVGQFVLAGEPVGAMGRAASMSQAAGAIETDAPVLYVEFRKDGGPIDPGPWWSKSQSEKARG